MTDLFPTGQTPSPDAVRDFLPSITGSLDPDLRDFVEYFRSRHSRSLLAVILYGSCVHDSTRKPDSIHDFILICDSYRSFHGGILHTMLNAVLPPNVYYLEIPRPGGPAGARLACKYNVVSLEALIGETSSRARDLFLSGRLGKQVRLIYHRDDQAARDAAGCVHSAMLLNLRYLLPTLPPEIPLDDLLVRLLALSYEGDYRIERDTKVRELFSAGRDYYRRMYARLLDEESGRGLPVARRGDTCLLRLSPADRDAAERRTRAFLRRSRRRSVYRWPKAIVTFGNYVDYLISKVERAQGIRIVLTPWERRFPLILGWRHFFRLKRRGLLK